VRSFALAGSLYSIRAIIHLGFPELVVGFGWHKFA
jgi:hypothetical protein